MNQHYPTCQHTYGMPVEVPARRNRTGFWSV